MKRKIAIVWIILSAIYFVGLGISLFTIITNLMEHALNQKLIEVIGIPFACVAICIVLTFAFLNTIQSYKNDVLVDENDTYKVEELGLVSRKNGQIIFGLYAFILFLALLGIVVLILVAIYDAIKLWIAIVGSILCAVVGVLCFYGIKYNKKLYAKDDYEVGLIYLRSLKK